MVSTITFRELRNSPIVRLFFVVLGFVCLFSEGKGRGPFEANGKTVFKIEILTFSDLML